MKIFVSHSTKDNDLYFLLAEELKKQGHAVINSVDNDFGEKWIDRMKNDLNKSDCLVAIITENYLNSSWNTTELNFAIFSTKIRVIPVVLNDIFLPSVLMGYRYIRINTSDNIVAIVLNEIKKINISDKHDNIPKKEIAKQAEKSDTSKNTAT